MARVQFSAEVRPAALLVGLEDAVDHALDDAAVALLAAAQAALGVAERGQVGVDDDGAERAPVGGHHGPAAGQQRERAVRRVDAHLDVAHLVAAQRAQQRRLVRAEAAARRGACSPKSLRPLERVQAGLAARCGGRRSRRGGRRRRQTMHALAELLEHGGEEAALLLERVLQRLLLARCRGSRASRA